MENVAPKALQTVSGLHQRCGSLAHKRVAALWWVVREVCCNFVSDAFSALFSALALEFRAK